VILKISFIFSIVSCSVLFTAENTFAWGVGLHIMQGTYILKHLNLIAPDIAVILKAFPFDYLYGCISADIFIGKGVKKRWDHCHNWSLAKKMLLKADSDDTTAFVYGYLSHLAADIISHNFYVPNQFYLTSSTKRFGHVYWESRSDEFINKKFWKTARTIIEKRNHHNDVFLQEMVKRKLVSFKMKKRFFFHSVKLSDLVIWQKAVALVSKKSRWEVEKTYIEELNRHSINLIIDFLKHGEKSICFKFDPIGSEKLLSAKKKRREDKKGLGTKPKRALFRIPANIKKLSYLKTANLL
tara:strand:+ start:1452 stop:2342 length:891 start_codon:yes stop_codon:yes gene_type:complete